MLGVMQTWVRPHVGTSDKSCPSVFSSRPHAPFLSLCLSLRRLMSAAQLGDLKHVCCRQHSHIWRSSSASVPPPLRTLVHYLSFSCGCSGELMRLMMLLGFTQHKTTDQFMWLANKEKLEELQPDVTQSDNDLPDLNYYLIFLTTFADTRAPFTFMPTLEVELRTLLFSVYFPNRLSCHGTFNYYIL